MANQNVTIPQPLNPGDTLTVTVGDAPPTITGVSVAGPATLLENATAQYTAHVTGTGSFNPAVVWSCSDGTISQNGLFTAPAKVENVIVTATSVQDPTKAGTCPVAISMPSNTVKIAPSGGDDTAALQAAFNSTASAGKILEMLVGTWHLNPINWPQGGQLLIDPGVLITDESAYAAHDVMFNVANITSGTLTGTGAFAQMPLSLAQSLKDGQEYRHCFAIGAGGPVANLNFMFPKISEAGGDGVYIRQTSNSTLTNPNGTGCYRNGISLTGKVSNLTLNNPSVNANLRGGFDIEPNTPADFITNLVINNLVSTNANNTGFNIAPYALDNTSSPVSIVINGYTSTNDGGYGIFFANGNFGQTPPGSIVVNNPTVTNSGFGAIYGRYAGSGPQITFNNVVIVNPNQKGTDPHYGMNSACGVDLTGGQGGPCGAANFNIKSISSNNGKMVNYFQQGNQGGNAVKTTFGVVPGGTLSGATNPNAITKYP